MTEPRVALVTGGGRGIGAAVSLRLAADGYAVAVNYSRSSGEAEIIAKTINESGGRAVAIQADVADPGAAADLIARTTGELGAPSVLVNNAGMNHAASARRLTPEQWNRVIAVNLNAAFYCTHAALPAMYDQGWGRVIFVSSPVGSRLPMPGEVAYAAAKAGVAAFSRCLAKEVARRGITVNTVMPGFVDTDMTQSAGAQAMEALRSSWPQIPAEAIASTVSFLAGADAAHVSGEELGVWRGGPVQI